MGIKLSPFAAMKSLAGAYKAKQNPGQSYEEVSVTVPMGLDGHGLYNFSMAFLVFSAGAFFWYAAGPFIVPAPTHARTFAAIRAKDIFAAEHLKEISKAVNYDMPLAALAVYKDKEITISERPQ